PSVGNSFTVMTYGSHVGTFSAVNLPAITSGFWDVRYHATDLTLVVVAGSTSTPNVTGVSPSSGTTNGGTSVTITGTSLTGILTVFFGTVPASDFVVNSSTSITALAPAQAAGTIVIVISNPSGSSAISASDQYTYSGGSSPTVSSLSTSLADPAGDFTYVTITGTNFSGVTGIDFGTTPADWFVVNSSTTITALAPPHSPGTVDVTVTNLTGTSSTSSATHITYGDPPLPTLTSL